MNIYNEHQIQEVTNIPEEYANFLASKGLQIVGLCHGRENAELAASRLTQERQKARASQNSSFAEDKKPEIIYIPPNSHMSIPITYVKKLMSNHGTFSREYYTSHSEATQSIVHMDPATRSLYRHAYIDPAILVDSNVNNDIREIIQNLHDKIQENETQNVMDQQTIKNYNDILELQASHRDAHIKFDLIAPGSVDEPKKQSTDENPTEKLRKLIKQKNLEKQRPTSRTANSQGIRIHKCGKCTRCKTPRPPIALQPARFEVAVNYSKENITADDNTSNSSMNTQKSENLNEDPATNATTL